MRARISDASIYAYMFVCFPRVTADAFDNSVLLADDVLFQANMVGAYSARPNTTTAWRDNQLEEGEKKRRLDIMNRKMEDSALQRSQSFLGQVVEVLLERFNSKFDWEVMVANSPTTWCSSSVVGNSMYRYCTWM